MAPTPRRVLALLVGLLFLAAGGALVWFKMPAWALAFAGVGGLVIDAAFVVALAAKGVGILRDVVGALGKLPLTQAPPDALPPDEDGGEGRG